MGELTLLKPGSPKTSDNAETAAKLRELADEVERGDWGDVLTTITVIEHDDGQVSRFTTTRRWTDIARIVGLLEFAKHKTICTD